MSLRHILCVFAMCSLGAFIGGCSSSGRASESEKAISTMSDVSEQLDKAKMEVTDAMNALDGLSAGGDLQKSFKTYQGAVSDVQKAGEKARTRWADMQQRGKEYIAKWQAEAQTTTPEVRQGMEARREKIRANYESVQSSAKDVSNAYKPFLQGLQEIQKALSLDLSPSGVQSLQPAFSKAKSDGARLNQALDALKARLNEIRMGMAPSAT